MQDFSEHHYPRAVSGKSYRIPFDDERIEVFAHRMDLIYRCTTPDETRGELLRQYGHLAWLSRTKFLDDVFRAELFGSEPDPAPSTPRHNMRTFTSGDVEDFIIPGIRAWLRRLVAWLDRMEGRFEPTRLPFPKHDVVRKPGPDF